VRAEKREQRAETQEKPSLVSLLSILASLLYYISNKNNTFPPSSIAQKLTKIELK